MLTFCSALYAKCMQNVLGTNAHRTFLRHVVTGYRNLFGPPLVFTTMNVADTKHPLIKLMYEGGEQATWRLLEENAPDLGSMEEMLQRVAADPVSQAIFSDLMMQLFLKHFLGVDVGEGGVFGDSVAASGVPGIFGEVQAYFAPLESQGRGGLHAHMCVWVLQPISSRFLEQLRSGDPGPEWEQRLWSLRQELRAKVGSMMFDSVEEIGRQCGEDLGELHSLRNCLDLESEECANFHVWCEEMLTQRRSLEEYISIHKLDEAEADRLRDRWAEHDQSAEETPSARSLEGCQLDTDVSVDAVKVSGCCVCGSRSPVYACPGCRPCATDFAFHASGIHSWHQDLLWCGPEPYADQKIYGDLLSRAKSLAEEDLRSIATLSSIEGFCRAATLTSRLRFAQSECDPGAAILPGQAAAVDAVHSTLKHLLDWEPSEIKSTLQCPVQGAEDREVDEFVAWHNSLLSSLPVPDRLSKFVEDFKDSDPDIDKHVMHATAFRMILSCYAGLKGEDVNYVQMISDRLRERAAAPMRTGNALLDGFIRWRDTIALPADIVERYKKAKSISEGGVPPLPLSLDRQGRTEVDGRLEVNGACAFEPPEQAKLFMPSTTDNAEAEAVLRWRDGAVLQCAKACSYAPVYDEPRQSLLHGSGSRRDPCSELPIWRRLPPYKSSSTAGGRALILVAEDAGIEAQAFSRVFAWDARRNYCRSHIHRCKKTCYKKSSKSGSEKAVCRFNYVHGREVLWFPRRWPAKVTPCRSLHCQLCSSQEASRAAAGVPVPGHQSLNLGADGRIEITCAQHAQKHVHPLHCPADVPVGYVCRVAVPGKKLVHARDNKFLPEVSVDDVFGSVGRILPLRYHPDCSSSHPALQVAFRCNFDVQCMDRVFVLKGTRKVLRHKRVVVRHGSSNDVADGLSGKGASSKSSSGGELKSNALYCVRCKRIIEGTAVRENSITEPSIGPLHFGCLLTDQSWEYFDWQRRQHLLEPATSGLQEIEQQNVGGVFDTKEQVTSFGIGSNRALQMPGPDGDNVCTASAPVSSSMPLNGGGLDEDEASLEDECDYDQECFDVVAKDQSTEEQLAQEMYESMYQQQQTGVSPDDGEHPSGVLIEAGCSRSETGRDQAPTVSVQSRNHSTSSRHNAPQENDNDDLRLPIR